MKKNLIKIGVFIIILFQVFQTNAGLQTNQVVLDSGTKLFLKLYITKNLKHIEFLNYIVKVFEKNIVNTYKTKEQLTFYYFKFLIQQYLPTAGTTGTTFSGGNGSLATATSANPIRRMTLEKIPINLDSMRFIDNIPKTEYHVNTLSVQEINNTISKVSASGGGIIYLPAGTLRTGEKIILKNNIKIIGAPNYGTKFIATRDIDGGFFKFGGLQNVSVEWIDAGGAGIQDINGNNKNIRITHNFIHDIKKHNGTGNYSSGNEHFEVSYNHLKNIGDLTDWRVDTHHGCELRELKNSLILGNFFERCGMGTELSSGCINSGMIGNWVKNCGWSGKIVNSTNSLVLYNDFEGGIFQTNGRDPWMIQGSEKNAIIKYNRFGIPKGGNNSVRKSAGSTIKEFSYNVLAGGINNVRNDGHNLINVGAKYLTTPIPK